MNIFFIVATGLIVLILVIVSVRNNRKRKDHSTDSGKVYSPGPGKNHSEEDL